MPWLLRDGEVLATVEVAGSLTARARHHARRDGWDGVTLLQPARVGSTFAVSDGRDMAFCTDQLVVLCTRAVRPWRLCLPRPRGRCVLEAPAGAFERWQLHPGDQLEIKG